MPRDSMLHKVRTALGRSAGQAVGGASALAGGGSGGVPLVGEGWGACNPANPRNRRRRVSILVEQAGPPADAVGRPHPSLLRGHLR